MHTFLSLRWKIFGMLVAILMVIQAGYSILTYRHLVDNSQAEQQKLNRVQLNVLDGLLDNSYQRMLETADLLLTLQTETRAKGIKNFTQFSHDLDRIYPSLAASGSFDALGIFNEKAQLKRGWGGVIELGRSQIRTVIEQESPVKGVRCKLRCWRYATVPILIDNIPHVLVIAKDLSNLVLDFKLQSGIDAGVAMASSGTDDLKRISLLLMTNRTLTSALLVEGRHESPLALGSNIIKYNGAVYQLYIQMLPYSDGEPGYWLMVSDITAAKESLSNTLIESYLLFAAGLALAAFLQLLSLRGPLKRLSTIARLLPQLGLHQYDNVRENLAVADKKNILFDDELTTLHTSAKELTGQLECLELFVSERTERLNEQNQELKQERNFVASLLDTAQVIVITQNKDGKVASINKYGRTCFNITEAVPLSMSFEQLHVEQSGWPEHEALLQKLFSGEIGHCQCVSAVIVPPRMELDIAWRHCLLKEHINGQMSVLSIGTDITEYKRVERHLYWLANHDPLTECPNRLFFNSHMQQLIAQNKFSQLALLFFDLDSFKDINDSLGHPVGDQLLQQVVKRVQLILPPDSLLSRQGGDEFTISLNCCDLPVAEKIAQEVINLLRDPFEIDGYEIFSTASLGIAIYPDHATDVVSLVKNADAALFEAKANGKDQYCIYDNSVASERLARFSIIGDLRQALERDQFELYYQPKIDALHGRVVGAEALIRWHHPDHGMVSPVKFIPLAEELGLIIPVGEWVLRQACRDLVAWVDMGNKPFRMAVNIAGQQVIHEGLIPMVESVLEDFDIDPSFLELEVTESFLLKQPEMAAKKLQALRNMGIHLSMDDFGTGFSSLSYLKRLPLNMLKIDRSFILGIGENANDESIIKAIIALCDSLNIEVLAEGVESKKQLDFLLEQQCNLIQGYLYSQPLPFDEFVKFLAMYSASVSSAGSLELSRN